MGEKIASGRIDISIIVPVYNTEKYIERCLDSIFSQQFSGFFEVIAVDDCSRDGSLQVLRKYQGREARLKIIMHEVNKKQSVARASGMSIAKGKYIMHVDSDDWLLPGALENIYEKALETGADVVVYNYLKEDAQGNRTLITKIKKQLVTSEKLQIHQFFYGTTVNKMVKRVFTEHMISGRVGVNNSEDLLYSTEILLRVGKICLIPEYYYVYFENRKSVTWSVKPEGFLRCQVVIFNSINEILSKYPVNLKILNNILNYFEKWIYLEIAKIHFWDKKKPVIVKNLLKEYRKYSNIPKYRTKSLELSIQSKFVCLLLVIKYFGLRVPAGIILRSFK